MSQIRLCDTSHAMKTIINFAMLLIATVVYAQADTKPVVVSIDTPSSGWSVKIQSAHTHNDKLLVVCQLSHGGGVSLSVISKVNDTIELPENLAAMKREIYVLGKTWNWGKGYTAVTDKELKTHLKGSKSIYTVKAENEDQAPAKKLKGDHSDFINLKYENAVTLAKQRKLPHRIVKKDGVFLPVTRDYRPNRLNFSLEKGIVTHVSRG